MNTDVQTIEKIYVWTKSERAGDIVQVSQDQNDSKWIQFTDNTKINASLVGEYLLEAKDMEDAKMLAGSFNPVNNQVSQKLSTGGNLQKTERKITDFKPEPEPEINVMMEMLKKMSTKNQAEMPVLVNIPSSQVYSMLIDQMDLSADDLNEQIGLLIENQINNLQSQLKSQIKTFITNYYKNEQSN